MEITAQPTSAGGAGNRQQPGPPATLREAAQEFESLFIGQMLRAMRATVPETNLLGGGSGQRVFREMLDQELALKIARSGGLGIGEMLYQQLQPRASEADPTRTARPDGSQSNENR